MVKRLIFLFSLVCIATTTFAQTGSIRGFVYDKGTGEPMIFTNVVIQGTAQGVATDVNGYFSLTKLQPGEITLKVSSLGYDSLVQTYTVKANEITTVKMEVSESSVQMQAVQVSAAAQEKTTEVKISDFKITPKEMQQIPTIGGEPDLAQYLQVIPGVVFTGDQGGQIYIRGGSPVQNKVMLDGMVIYNPFHSIGFFSVFDPDIIRNADVSTGGFNAEHGGRTSSIMDITTRNGNTRRFGGKVAVNPFLSRLLLEGPLKKSTDDNEGSSSFIFSGKHSYLAESSKALYTYIDSGGLPFGFTDLYGKMSFNASNGSKFNVFGFHFRDNVNYQAVSDYDWKTSGFGSNFILVPSGSPVLISGDFAYSQYGITLQEENQPPDSSTISGFNLGLDFTYFLGRNELKYGIEVIGFATDFTFFNSVNRKIEQEDFTTEIAGYFKYRITKDKVVIEPSFRMHYYASLATFSPEPRLGLKYNLAKKFRLKYAGGFYSQNLLSANSDRDVVNLFYGFLSSPENLPKTYNDEDVRHRLQKAIHNIAGFEYDISKRISLNVEGYLINFTQLTNINRDKLFDDTEEYSEIPDYQKKDFIIEKGRAYGIDVLLKYDYRQLYIWAVYSLGRVTREYETETGIDEYFPHYDRRHNVNLVAAYKFGKGNTWELDARWNMGSGFPFTQTQGYYELLDFNGDFTGDYTTENGSLGIQYDDLNTGRLPYYHRLDLTLKKKFIFNENSELEANVGVTNAYNRQNIFYFDRIKYERVDQLPVLPSAGVSFTF